MGKPRKVEIDDLMPVDKNDEIILPKCENLEELWPAIITKAVIKLFSYKYKSNAKPENIVGDIQIINSLTGYFSDIKKSNLLKGEMEVGELLDKLDIINNSNNKENINNNKELKENRKNSLDQNPLNNNTINNPNNNNNANNAYNNMNNDIEKLKTDKDTFFMLCYNFKSSSDVKEIKKFDKKKLGSCITNKNLPMLKLEKNFNKRSSAVINLNFNINKVDETLNSTKFMEKGELSKFLIF